MDKKRSASSLTKARPLPQERQGERECQKRWGSLSSMSTGRRPLVHVSLRSSPEPRDAAVNCAVERETRNIIEEKGWMMTDR